MNRSAPSVATAVDGSGFAAVNRLRRLCQAHLITAAAKNHSLAGRRFARVLALCVSGS